MDMKWTGFFELEIRDKFGNVTWKKKIHNALTNQGENSVLNTYFRATTQPTAFYFRLCNDSLDVGDALTTIVGEPASINGYEPKIIERTDVGWPTIELNEGAWRIVSKQVTITASGGDIGPVNTGFLATTLNNTGLLVAFVNFDVPRTILDGSSLIARYQVKLT